MNHKNLRRIHTEERAQVRRRGERKRAVGTRAPIALTQAPNQRWSLDFASDVLAPINSALLAQRIERPTFNQVVPRSIPGAPTN